MFEMRKLFLLSVIATLMFSLQEAYGQVEKALTFDEVIKLSEEQSPNALIAKHTFRSSYWEYRTFVAQYRPSLTLSGNLPSYSKGSDRQWDKDQNSYYYSYTDIMQNIGNLSLSQNIGFTGGTISLNSGLNFENNYIRETKTFKSSPVAIQLVQPLFKYNSLKWEKKTEPVKYEAAKRTFLYNIETVHQRAVANFFALALAQINVQIAEMNFSNSDTLYRMAAGRYKLGTIAEDELLQMELTWLNAQNSMKEAEMNLRDKEIRLRSFLGFNENVRLVLILPNEIPTLQIDVQKALTLAHANNPTILNQQLTILTAQSKLAEAKASRGLNADLTFTYGLDDSGSSLSTVYDDPLNSQGITIGVKLPILDWGLGKGKYKMAQSSLELAKVQSEQTLVDFDQNLTLDVEQFNLQGEQVAIAAKSDTVAMKMYDVTKARFLIGKIDVLELSNADTKKDENRRAYIQALQNYWSYFYNVRSLSLYDFVNDKPLETDYSKLLQ